MALLLVSEQASDVPAYCKKVLITTFGLRCYCFVLFREAFKGPVVLLLEVMVKQLVKGWRRNHWRSRRCVKKTRANLIIR